MKYPELEEIKTIISQQNEIIETLGKELASLLQAPDDIVVLLYSRRCLETMIIQLCIHGLKRDRGTEPLKGLIDKLYKEDIIPAFIHTSMQNVNNISNYGAHPKEFNPRQVKSTINELATILEWFFDYAKDFPKEDSTITSRKIVDKPETVQEKPKKTATDTSETKKANFTVIIVILLILGLGTIIVLYKINQGKTPSEVEMTDTSSTVLAAKEDDKEKELMEEKREEISPLETKDKEAIKETDAVKKEPKPVIASYTKEQLEKEINILTNSTIAYKIREKKKLALIKVFSLDAVAEIKSASGYVERKLVSEYFNAITLRAVHQIKVEEITKSGNQITFLKVIESKK